MTSIFITKENTFLILVHLITMRFFNFRALFLLCGITLIVGCGQNGSSGTPGPAPGPTFSNPPVSLRFSSPVQTIIAKSCSSPVKIESIDLNSSLANVVQDASFSLSGTGLSFYSDSSCLTLITSASIKVGTSQAQFYVKSPTLGSPIISVTNSSLGQIYQQLSAVIGPASQLVSLIQPTDSIAGQTMSLFSVQIQDAYGNDIHQSGIQVALSVNTVNIFAYGTIVVATSQDGSAQFNNVRMNQANGFTFNFSSQNILSVNSSSFIVSPSLPIGISFVSFPSSGTANLKLFPALKVGVIDQYGNTVQSVSSTTSKVTVTPYSDSNCTTVKGSLSSATTAFFQGVADYTFSSPSQLGLTYFKAVSTGYGQRCSASVYVTPQLGLTQSSVNINSNSSYNIENIVKGGSPPYSYSVNTSIGSSVNGVGVFTSGSNLSSSPTTETVTISDYQSQQIQVNLQIYQALTLNISKTSMVAGTSQQLLATGGQPPYSYSVVSGGGGIDSSGILTASQSVGSIIARLMDSSGQGKNYQIQVSAALAASAPSSNVLLNQTQQISVSGGISPYSFSLISGPGSISTSGLFQASAISGVTKVKVQDSNSNNLTLSFMTFSGGATHLTFSSQPGNGTIGENIFTMPIVLALNNVPDVDYTYGNQVLMELFDQSCSTKVLNQSLSLTPGVFLNGRFQPEILKINSAGIFTLKVTQNDMTTCSNSFTISGVDNKIFVGKNNVCKISNGALQCLGSNDFGQLTSLSNSYSETLSSISTSGLVTDVSIGPSHICAIDNGQLKCWGNNSAGQLGSSPASLSSSKTVSLVNSIATYSYGVSLGDQHSCSIIGSNLNCWGNDDFHQLGRGSPYSGNVINCLNITNTNTCQNVGCKLSDPCVGNVTATSCSNSSNQCNFDFASGICHMTSTSPYSCQGTTSYSCELINSQNDCSNLGCDWANSSCHSSGANFTSSGSNPLAVSGINGVVMSVASSANSNCAIIESQVFCWGNNSSGQDGSISTRVDIASKVAALENAKQVSVGKSHSCAVNNDQAYCWGANDKGQLGNGSSSLTPNPQPQVVALPNVTKVVTGDYFSCALNSSGIVYCWGANDVGQVGVGAITTKEMSPRMVSFPSRVIDISSGGSSACAISSDFITYCWGYNDFNHFESTNKINYSSPTVIH